MKAKRKYKELGGKILSLDELDIVDSARRRRLTVVATRWWSWLRGCWIVGSLEQSVSIFVLAWYSHMSILGRVCQLWSIRVCRRNRYSIFLCAAIESLGFFFLAQF